MKKLSMLLALGGLVALLIWTPPGHYVLAEAGRWLVVETPQKPVELIVALGGDRSREEAAANLLQAGRGKKLLFVGADARYRDYECLALAADKCLPIPEKPAWTTGEEAAEIAEVVRARKIHTLLVVTNDYHTRRARWILRRALAGTNVDLEIFPVPSRAFKIEEWWRYHMGIKAVVTEYAGMAYYWVRSLVKSKK